MLPPELWSATCRFLDHRDSLAKVARTSSQLSAAASPFLYRSVNLRSDQAGIQATFDLLRSDRSLARNVQDIHIYTAWQRGGEASSWLYLGAISHLTQLKSMTMIGSPFQTVVEQDTFLKILQRSCPLLKEFTYRQSHYATPHFLPTPHPTRFPGRNFCITGIEKLTWDDNDYGFTTRRQLHSLMKASLQTITHLSIPFELEGHGTADAATFFEVFIFPRLRAFEFGGWLDHDTEEHDIMEEALTGFLVAHPTIQDLTLNWDGIHEYTIAMSVSVLTPDILPNLNNLRCHPANIFVLLLHGARTLYHLTRLSVGHEIASREADEMDDMLDELISRGGLPCLKVLHFSPGKGCTDLWNTRRWMLQWSQICPGLQKWSGSLAVMELDELISIFSRFPRLTRIEVAYTMLPRGAGDVPILASRLPALRKVTVRPTEEPNIHRVTHHIQRDDLGAASQLVTRKYNTDLNQVTTTYCRLEV